VFILLDYTTRFIQHSCPTKIIDGSKIYVEQYIICERQNKEIRIDEGQCRKVMSSNNQSIKLNVELILPNSKARIPSFKENCFWTRELLLKSQNKHV
jgi:hypothetical protein